MEAKETTFISSWNCGSRVSSWESTTGVWNIDTLALRKDWRARGERMLLMLYFNYEDVKSLYRRTCTNSCVIKTQLSWEFCSWLSCTFPVWWFWSVFLFVVQSFLVYEMSVEILFQPCATRIQSILLSVVLHWVLINHSYSLSNFRVSSTSSLSLCVFTHLLTT